MSRKIARDAAMRMLYAVSYTHLDVYKRQKQETLPRPMPMR